MIKPAVPQSLTNHHVLSHQVNTYILTFGNQGEPKTKDKAQAEERKTSKYNSLQLDEQRMKGTRVKDENFYQDTTKIMVNISLVVIVLQVCVKSRACVKSWSEVHDFQKCVANANNFQISLTFLLIL